VSFQKDEYMKEHVIASKPIFNLYTTC